MKYSKCDPLKMPPENFSKSYMSLGKREWEKERKERFWEPMGYGTLVVDWAPGNSLLIKNTQIKKYGRIPDSSKICVAKDSIH